jgi:hypothetical protein
VLDAGGSDRRGKLTAGHSLIEGLIIIFGRDQHMLQGSCHSSGEVKFLKESLSLLKVTRSALW